MTQVVPAATATGEPGAAVTVTRPPPTPTAVGIQATVEIQVTEHPKLGTVLTDANGRTLYLSTDDERNISRCSGGCATAFPPLLTSSEPTAGDGIAAGRVRTITRQDGLNQVTYNGWPLYYFAADEDPGDAMGQNVGGAWFAVSPYGGPIQNNALVKTFEHPEFGTILVDASGRTLYLFTVDERSKSNCLEGCAVAWPPLLTVGDPAADKGIAAGRMGAITREDGSSQVSYNGWPLYYFAPDARPGDARGQNVGDIWFVVSTYGGPIQSNAVVKSSDHPELGVLLTDRSGRTVYLSTDDEKNRSACTRGCALAWPPLLTVGLPSPEEDVAVDRLGTIVREDGYTQVTYNGWPLYYFAPDERPGDATGQSIGDAQFVVSVEGAAVTATPTVEMAAMEHLTLMPTPTALAVARPPTPTPTATPTTRSPIPGPIDTPTPVPARAPSPTPMPSTAALPAVQEIATIENYAASRFFPGRVVVVKDIPVDLYMTRLHREHVNRFNNYEATATLVVEETALLETMLAQAKADAENVRESLDTAEAQQALLATFIAWNRKDSEEFADGFTEGGMAASFLSLPGSIGAPTITVRRIMETTVSGDTATIHAMYGLGTQRSSVVHSMVKENGTWKIDDEEKLSPKVSGNTETVDIDLHDCGFSFESTVISSRNVAFALYNVGEQAPRLVLSRVPGDIDLNKTLQGGGSASQGMGPIAFVDTLAPGDRINVAFTQPLAAGRYALLCFVPGPDDVELTDTVSGIVAELLVN